MATTTVTTPQEALFCQLLSRSRPAFASAVCRRGGAAIDAAARASAPLAGGLGDGAGDDDDDGDDVECVNLELCGRFWRSYIFHGGARIQKLARMDRVWRMILSGLVPNVDDDNEKGPATQYEYCSPLSLDPVRAGYFFPHIVL